MPYLRRLPPIPLNGRVTARLTPDQRNLVLAVATLPPSLAHALAHASVRHGKLTVELKRESLDRLILAAAATRAPGRAADRELVKLLAYLESLADRFEEPPEEATSVDHE